MCSNQVFDANIKQNRFQFRQQSKCNYFERGVSISLPLNLYFTVFIDIFSATEFWAYLWQVLCFQEVTSFPRNFRRVKWIPPFTVKLTFSNLGHAFYFACVNYFPETGQARDNTNNLTHLFEKTPKKWHFWVYFMALQNILPTKPIYYKPHSHNFSM